MSASRGDAPENFDSRPPRELATGADGPAHRLGDLLERHLEHVVKHERHPLTGTQPPQHLQQRGADLVVEGDPVGGIDFPRRGGHRERPTRRVVRGGREPTAAGPDRAGLRRPSARHGRRRSATHRYAKAEGTPPARRLLPPRRRRASDRRGSPGTGGGCATPLRPTVNRSCSNDESADRKVTRTGV